MVSNAAYAVKKFCLGAMCVGFIVTCTAWNRDSIRRWKAFWDQEQRKRNLNVTAKKD